MGVEYFRKRFRAQAGSVDLRRRHSGGRELIAVRERQIELKAITAS